MNKIIKILFMSVSLTLFYVLWTKTTDLNNLLIMAVIAVIISVIYKNSLFKPIIAPKKLLYLIWYVGFLFVEILKANFDVARRVIMPVIPINPGIVTVKTKLRSKIGRMILANSITLTPGTLTVDIDGDRLFIHWIDVTKMGENEATKTIVSNFEKYLEVIFG